MRPVATLASVLAAAAVLAACGGGSSTSSTSAAAEASAAGAPSTLRVTATGEACELSATTLPAGKVTVEGTSTAAGEAEIYLYGLDNGAYTKIIGEVEGLTAGLTKEFSAEVQPGTYEVKCEVSGSDDVRVPLTVG